ncbi:MAG: 1,4-dihydroxy-2-naphthoate octaprenyltransferase [Bacteroidetes bacterium]|nr:1,4-dihydroxy-2-naphthoate octaprenyltransferase [Bacteroidota bacterium]MDA0904287.1 1,4-dihydroxy-2-naphthoate octaprenyltransferase [Bacteroidota bacterium]MDA1241851.1 1,4-dihydroxy-2-naphthoate octaprenyltransferase [Bacteroidota bacterium]
MNPWIKAARLRTLPLAVTCVLLGASLAHAEGLDSAGLARFWPVVVGALSTVILLQVVANFANDYGDYIKGTDTAAGRKDRALASGALSASSMKRALVITALSAFLAGIATLVVAFVPGVIGGTEGGNLDAARMGILGALGVAGIVAAMRYTIGSKAYGYQGLGDVYVMVFFGWVGVLGVGLLVAHHVSAIWVLPAFFSGCMSVAVLNLNNLRDHESDALAGKNTTVVRLGFRGGKIYHLVVLALGWGALGVFFLGPWNDGVWRGTLWYGLIALVHARHAVDVWKCHTPAELNPELKRVALSSFLVALFMFMDQTLTP